jgi:hypothetical protein
MVDTLYQKINKKPDTLQGHKKINLLFYVILITVIFDNFSKRNIKVP